MRQKRVSGGQKIHGNLSAKAISELPRLIENEQLRELNKPGGPINTIEGPGLFVYAKATSTLATGEWTYLNRPVFPSTASGVNEATWFQRAELLEAATPASLGSQTGGQYVKQLLPAMAIEPRRPGELTRYQIGGLARTRIQFPAGVLAASHVYRTAHIGTNAVPIATATDSGDLDIIWHKEIDAANRIHAAIVRFPTGPRPPRLVQYRARCPGIAYNGGSVATSLWTREVGTPNTNYIGIGPAASAANLQFLRGGEYRVSLNAYLDSYSWTSRASRSGRIVVQLLKSSGGGSWTGISTIAANAKAVDAIGDPLTNQIIASGSRVIEMFSGDEMSLQASADIGTAEVRVQVIIDGPYNNHYPETTTYF